MATNSSSIKRCFWFRTNLRIHDNPAITCLKGPTIFLYCLSDSQQLSAPYAQFLISSLSDLAMSLMREYNSKLHLFYDNPRKLLPRICIHYNIREVITCESNVHDNILDIYDELNRSNIELIIVRDNLRRYISVNAAATEFTGVNISIPTLSLDEIASYIIKPGKNCMNSDIMKGGRSAAVHLLTDAADNANKDVINYIIPYLELGCVSKREVPFITDTITRRDQLIQLAEMRPNLLADNVYLLGLLPTVAHSKFNRLPKKQKIAYSAWINGVTGYSSSDQTMLRLEKCGFVTERALSDTVTFAQTVLGIHWTHAREYIMKKIIFSPDSKYVRMLWLWITVPSEYLDTIMG